MPLPDDPSSDEDDLPPLPQIQSDSEAELDEAQAAAAVALEFEQLYLDGMLDNQPPAQLPDLQWALVVSPVNLSRRGKAESMRLET